MGSFFHTVLYIPIYNLLMFLVDILPGADIGLAVIIATLIVKIAIAPLSFAALRTTRAVKAIDPELRALKEKYKDDKEAQAKEMFALYKKYGINPLAGVFTLLIQLPIVFTLYIVFNNKTLLTVDPSILYSFVPTPETISPLFLGIFAVAGSSLILASIAGVTQLLQALYAIPVPPKSDKPGTDMQADFGRAMALQMRFMLPVFVGVAAYFTSNAIALYFITTAIVSLGQEYLVRRQKFSPPDSTSAPV